MVFSDRRGRYSCLSPGRRQPCLDDTDIGTDVPVIEITTCKQRLISVNDVTCRMQADFSSDSITGRRQSAKKRSTPMQCGRLQKASTARKVKPDRVIS